MDIEIAGVSLYYIISWFFVYSFLGWLWETAYVSVRKKKFVKDKKTIWDGVRNYAARLNLNAMKKGDEAFFLS